MSKRKRSAADVIKAISTLDSSNKYSDVHIEFSGDKEVSIDGLYGVLEYNAECIRLSAGRKELLFRGDEMSMDVFDLGQAVIKGRILSMEFCK